MSEKTKEVKKFHSIGDTMSTFDNEQTCSQLADQSPAGIKGLDLL